MNEWMNDLYWPISFFIHLFHFFFIFRLTWFDLVFQFRNFNGHHHKMITLRIFDPWPIFPLWVFFFLLRKNRTQWTGNFPENFIFSFLIWLILIDHFIIYFFPFYWLIFFVFSFKFRKKNQFFKIFHKKIRNFSNFFEVPAAI